MVSPLPIHFDIAQTNGTQRVQGWVIPETENALAVHERWLEHWHVTHVPTGRGVMPPGGAELTTRDQAMGFGRRFYREATALGVDLKSSNWEEIRGPLFYDIGHAERASFWERVL